MERSKGRTIAQAAMMAGMTEKTAAGYIHSGKLPSEQVKERDWQTREDPFNPSFAIRGLNRLFSRG